MKKGKILALLLSLSMVCAAFPAKTAAAVGGSGDGESGSAEGMEYTKTATYNEDGTYTITLEAYATGEKLIIDGKKEKPTDIVLVLDQSGSMAEGMNSYEFRKYTDSNNEDFYELRHNGGESNLYYQIDDGSYVSVSVEYEDTSYSYRAIEDENNSYYYENQNNLYALVNGEYQKVTVTRSGRWSYTYTYKLGQDEIAESTGRFESPSFGDGVIDGNCLYLASADESNREYTYSYTDAEGKRFVIETSTGVDTTPEHTFYGRYQTGSTTKLDALITAVTNFTNSVSEKAAGEDGKQGTSDDVNHRIAIVGFSSNTYDNTELLTGSEISQGNRWYGMSAVVSDWYGTYYFPTGWAQNGPNYPNITNQQYKDALLGMNTTAGVNGVKDGINALTAYGGTQTQNGLEMANKIFENNLIEDEERNRVVILFTDGIPGQTGWDSSVATSAINKANLAKNYYGATVYSIGIFNGADATDPGSNDRWSSETDRANWFMQNVSSNNGKVQDPSYYLSAADAETLNNIFEQISDNIEQGGSDTTLDEDTVIRDWVAESFALPEGTTENNITLETYHCTGKTDEGYIWEENSDSMGARAAVDATSGEVEVTGFDFAENYVGTVTENGETTYRGNKLVISFTIEPKEGFLGGNQVPTNNSAGIYENRDAKEPVFEYEVPVVDVPIEKITVTAPDKDIYLLQDVSLAELRQGTTVKVGDVNLDLTEENYGLEDWQHDYVQIQDRFMANGGELTEDMTDRREDTSYTATVTVTPKTPKGDAAEQTGSDDGNINVYKPELIFEDSTVYYGDTAPADQTYNTVNLTDTKWKHTHVDGTVTEANETAMDPAPNLGVTYIPESDKIVGGKINTKEDIEVNAEVKIGNVDVTDDTSFSHTKCDGETQDPANGKFWLHVKTCDLTIVKTGGANDEPYVFEIYKDNSDTPYTEITITGNKQVTISELPVGNYSIQEAWDWSWRYTPTYKVNGNEGNSATLSGKNPNATITCTNKKNNNPWLNGYSTVAKNVYGEEHSN